MKESKPLYSADEVAQAVEAATKQSEKFLTDADVADIAAQVGAPVEAVQRELAARGQRREPIVSEPLRVEAVADSMRISAAPPGLRSPVLLQLSMVLVTGSLTLSWLYHLPYWFFGAALLWLYWFCVVASVAFHRCTIFIDGTNLVIETRGWFGEERHRVDVSPRLELRVERSGERMPVEFFPMYHLEVRSADRSAIALRAHSVATIEYAQQAIRDWLGAYQRSASTASHALDRQDGPVS